MKKSSPFLAGIAVTTMIFGLGTTALAASGQVTFNMSPIQFNGQQISAKGADYTLDNGCQAPSSITYTDEKGGGTTYLPVRRVAELMGVEIGYDAATGAVTVSGEKQVESQVESQPETTPTPDTYNFDYSYGEFEGLWKVTEHNETLIFVAIDDSKTIAWWESSDSSKRDEYLLRAAEEGLKEFGLASNLVSIFRINSIDNMATVYWGEVHYKH